MLIQISCVFSQNINYKKVKSDIFQDDYKNSVIVLSEENTNGELLLVRSYKGTIVSQGEGFYIEYYDTNLKFKRAFEYSMNHPNYQKYNLILGVFMMQNNIHFVEIYYDLNEKSFVCLDNILSQDFSSTKKELFRISRDEMKNYGKFNLQQKFYDRTKEIWTNDNSGKINSENELANLSGFHKVFFSGNNNYKKIIENENQGNGSDIILVVNEQKNSFLVALDFNQEEKDGLKLYLYDDKGNKKFETIYSNTIEDKKYFFQNLQISEDGNFIYLLAKTYSFDAKKKNEGGKYFYEFTKISNYNQLTTTLNTNEHFVGSLNTFIHNDELTCLGFYSDVKDFKYSGICCFKIDPNTLEVKSANYNPFTEQFLFDKYGDSKPKDLKNLNIKKVFFTENNEILLNAEENYISQSGVVGYSGANNSPMQFGNSDKYYCYDDIVIGKLDALGTLQWARNINKKQSTNDDDNSFISYTSTIRNNKNYLFVNTKDKIKKLKNDRNEFGQIRKNKSNLNVIQVDENGDFEYEEILDDEQNEVPFMVSKGAIIDNSVYFLGRKGRNKQLLKVTL